MPGLSRPPTVRFQDEVRTFIAFGLVGAVNSILPLIVFSANYLIIPFPRAVVTILEILPALLIKLILPPLLRHVNISYRLRPLLLASCWVLTRIVTAATPPNVPPAPRILMTLLASAASAATDVSCLGQLRHYGLAGLAGWGVGTGTGRLLCALFPLAVTVWQGRQLRQAIEHILPLTAVMLVAFLLVLPRPAVYRRDPDDVLDDDLQGEPGVFLLQQDPRLNGAANAHHAGGATVAAGGKLDALSKNVKQNIGLTRPLVKPYMTPLFVAFVVQAVVYPGIARALAASLQPDFLHYSTVYGLFFHAGNLLARSSVLFFRIRRPRSLLSLLLVALASVLVNAYFLISAYAIFLMAFVIGFLVGAVYVNIFARILEDDIYDADAREFALGAASAGEAAGLLFGGIVGTVFEAALCSLPVDGTRWCHRTR
ncbi:hypothetical protein SODALDRAFT_142008 [Sodiomyces alkalinus F11]|uniref:Protein BTN n=1 Tax=Sodiomyces alkalinus (strain CBS 110278 / VKM F-3762 / F11) TaxID=1314773 RepID=A0A3N2PZK4_SODAK|nr:hypothetical protein SODALDRAFT_142008 [Sodiomyces alkalinus F11]ROT39944.1 hypothetical protein SODALDRAFT_142008 [Sodiomyces alkalinus F11]